MKCRVGDRVRFLNDVGGGKVTRIIDKHTVAVMNEDGFEVPVLESEIIIIDQVGEAAFIKRIPEEIDKSDEKRSSTSSKDNFNDNVLNQDVIPVGIPQETQVEAIDFVKIDQDIPDPEGELLGIFIAFVPVNQSNVVESDQELFLINDSPYRLFYTVSLWVDNYLKPIKAGFIQADTKEKITVLKRNELNMNITINVQIIFFKNVDYIPQQPEFCDLSINPIKFYRPGSFAENDFFDERALILSIADTKKEEMLKTLTEKAIYQSIAQKDLVKKSEPKIREPELVEVDLHIHQIIDDYSKLLPGEILEMQLARFKTVIETGLRSKNTRKMVFIHGLGNGKLKNEVIRKLKTEYPKLRYQDASFKEYGFGATLVFLK